MKRTRAADAIRRVNIKKNVIKNAAGSVLMRAGNTMVMCTASLEEKVPPFLVGTGKGWVTAEYGMLPASTGERKPRPRAGRVDGRTSEIQRLIGRSLRAVTRLDRLGERTIWIDCDVMQADGGTRTASITGAYVAFYLAMKKLIRERVLAEIPLTEAVAAISVGKVNGRMLLDLDYEEDSNADIDMNVVMTEGGKIVEVQGTAERNAFSKSELDRMMALAAKGIRKLIAIQKKVLK
jgi:ribonuclease PH